MDKIVIEIRSRLTYFQQLAHDPRTPRLSKWLIGLSLIYLLSPIDLIPDVVPILGQLDDLIIIPALLWTALRFIPQQVKREAESRQIDEKRLWQ